MKNIWIMFLKMYASFLGSAIVFFSAALFVVAYIGHKPGLAVALLVSGIVLGILQEKARTYLRDTVRRALYH